MKRLSVFLSFIAAMCVWAGNAHALVIETNEWSTRTQAGWNYTAGEKPSIDNTTNTPSGGGALKFTYEPGTYTQSTGGGKAEYANLTGRDIYVGHWFKFSPGFVWHPQTNKIDYMWVAIPQYAINSTGAFTIRTEYSGAILAADMTIQNNGIFINLFHSRYTNGSVRVIPGTWYWLEYHVTLNDVIGPEPATYDRVIGNGVLEIWLNDVLQGSWTDLRFTDRVGQTWKTFLHSPEYGGGQTFTIPSQEYLWIDHTVISTTRIGRPTSSPPGDTTAPRSPVLNFAN